MIMTMESNNEDDKSDIKEDNDVSKDDDNKDLTPSFTIHDDSRYFNPNKEKWGIKSSQSLSLPLISFLNPTRLHLNHLLPFAHLAQTQL